MTKTVRLIDVALASKASVKTVSRVLNKDPRVSDATRVRVQEKIDELGYQVDIIARSLRTGVDNVIGLVIQKIGDAFFAEVAEEIEIEANRRGYGVIIGSTHGDLERENQLVQGFKQRRVAGMIITPQDVDYAFMKSVSIPTVFIDRAPKNFVGDVVRVDDTAGAQMAMEHLVNFGHTDIAFFGDSPHVQTSELRFEGYKRTLKLKKIKFEKRNVFFDLDNEVMAETAVDKLLQFDSVPTAIFASRSEVGAGVAKALHRANRTDIALISFDDFRLADTLSPAISILDHSSRNLGRTAISKLFEKMDGLNGPPSEEILPLRVIARGSGELRPTR